MPLPSEVGIDTFLSGLIVGVRNARYIGIEVFPQIFPAKLTGKVARRNRDHMRVTFQPREKGAGTFEVDWGADSVPFDADEWTVKTPVDRIHDTPAHDDPWDAMRSAAFTVNEIVWGRVEAEISAIVMTNTNYPAAHQSALAGFDRWDSGDAASTPVDDVQDAVGQIVSQTGAAEDDMYGVCSYRVFQALRKHPQVKEAYLSTVPGRATVAQMSRDSVAAALGLNTLLVGNAVSDTEKQGATRATDYIWTSDSFAVFNRVPQSQADQATPNFGYTVSPRVQGLAGATVAVDTFYDADRKSDMVRGTALLDTIVVQGEFGYLYETVVG